MPNTKAPENQKKLQAKLGRGGDKTMQGHSLVDTVILVPTLNVITVKRASECKAEKLKFWF